jgi:RNA polymerase sigma-70 factor (ECF subfamily)
LLRRLRRFRGRIAAEDVVQAAFAKMLEVDEAQIEEPRAYLARITRNLAIDELRRHERGGLSFVDENELDRLGVGGGLTPEEMIIEGERFAT